MPKMHNTSYDTSTVGQPCRESVTKSLSLRDIATPLHAVRSPLHSPSARWCLPRCLAAVPCACACGPDGAREECRGSRGFRSRSSRQTTWWLVNYQSRRFRCHPSFILSFAEYCVPDQESIGGSFARKDAHDFLFTERLLVMVPPLLQFWAFYGCSCYAFY
jgi:hypothetical protein